MDALACFLWWRTIVPASRLYGTCCPLTSKSDRRNGLHTDDVRIMLPMWHTTLIANGVCVQIGTTVADSWLLRKAGVSVTLAVRGGCRVYMHWKAALTTPVLPRFWRRADLIQTPPTRGVFLAQVMSLRSARRHAVAISGPARMSLCVLIVRKDGHHVSTFAGDWCASELAWPLHFRIVSSARCQQGQVSQSMGNRLKFKYGASATSKNV